MKRSEFLKSLGLGAGGLILPSTSFLNTQKVKIYDNYVRGLIHYDFKKIRKELKEGDELQLIRESTNRYDGFAIRVNFGEKRLGYIAAFENVVLANMMDTGVNLKANISEISHNGNIYSALAVEVYAELIVPNPKFIDEINKPERADDSPDEYRLISPWRL